MRLAKRLTVSTALVLMLVHAYGQDVHYNYDRSTNFSRYRTYQWVDLPGPNGMVPDQLIDQDIKRAADEQLARKGLTRVETDADLKVAYHAIIHEQQGINLSASGTGGGPWAGGPGGWGGYGSGTITGQTSTIPVGMLLIDIYDPARNQLIWRGDATQTIDLKKDPNKNYRSLQKAMTKLFKNYPPAQK